MRIFSIFDIDKNAKIDLNEVKIICKSIGIHPSMVSIDFLSHFKRELKLMINEVSDSEDYTVTFE